MTRKASRRRRLLSESASTDHQQQEPLKGILKNSRIPTKRSVSECVDDLSKYMDELDINIDDLKSSQFCPLHPFPEQVEYEHDDSCDENHGCACYDRYRSDSSDGSLDDDGTKRPKKSVRFDEHIYQTVYIASRLYDRRAMAKYRFSTRHHPPPNCNKKQSKKRSC